METTETTVEFLEEFKELFNEEWRYIVFYGGRYSAKSHSVARALLLRGRQKKLRILCTREIQNTIKDSVHKLLSDLIDEFSFRDYITYKDSIVNTATGTEFIFKGLRHDIAEIKSTEGVDICWVEEAQAVREKSWDILTPTIRKPGSQIIITFNRLHELDPCYVKFVQSPPDRTFVKKVNYDVLERAGLLTDEIRVEMDNDRKDPLLFAHKWLGEPLSQHEMSIISRAKVLEAMQREVDSEGATEVGVDVARFGPDRTVFFKRKGFKCTKDDYKVLRKSSIPQTCDQLEKFVGFNKDILLRIDDGGVGGGVTDEMIKRGYKVVPVLFQAEPKDKDKYPDLISEAWFYLAEIIDEIQIPYNSDLMMELSSRQWLQDGRGRRKVESKDQYKRRGFNSPDLADALILCFYKHKGFGSYDRKNREEGESTYTGNLLNKTF